MYRYFALVWNPADAGASASARALSERLISIPLGWARVFAADGVCAFHKGLDEGASRTVLLDHDAGAVFGRIFNRDLDETARTVRVEFDQAETLKVVQTGGRRLIE